MAEPPEEPPGLAEMEVDIIQVHYHNIFDKNLGIIILWHRNWPKSQSLLEGDNSAARRISTEVNVGAQNSKYSRIINFE